MKKSKDEWFCEHCGVIMYDVFVLSDLFYCEMCIKVIERAEAVKAMDNE